MNQFAVFTAWVMNYGEFYDDGWMDNSLPCGGAKRTDLTQENMWCKCAVPDDGSANTDNGFYTHQCDECDSGNPGMTQPQGSVIEKLFNNKNWINHDHITFKGNTLDEYENKGQWASNYYMTPCLYDFMCPGRTQGPINSWQNCPSIIAGCRNCHSPNDQYMFGSYYCRDIVPDVLDNTIDLEGFKGYTVNYPKN